MNILSWNVAGIRAVIRKNALDFTLKKEYDVLCFQETKAEQSQVKNIDQITKLYPFQIWNHSKKRKGYSGTCILSSIPFESVVDTPDFDKEGRITCVEFEKFYLVNVYTPNSKFDLSRLTERIDDWDPNFRRFCNNLNEVKSVIICGDLNVCHTNLDIYDHMKYRLNIHAGFTKDERQSFQILLDTGYIDAFRTVNKDPFRFTYWSYANNARYKNEGWRLDYFLVSKKLSDCIVESTIQSNIYGSDHCPITIKIT